MPFELYVKVAFSYSFFVMKYRFIRDFFKFYLKVYCCIRHDKLLNHKLKLKKKVKYLVY